MQDFIIDKGTAQAEFYGSILDSFFEGLSGNFNKKTGGIFFVLLLHLLPNLFKMYHNRTPNGYPSEYCLILL